MRHQLAAYSPLSPAPLLSAALASIGSADGAKDTLRKHLAEQYAADHVLLCGSGTQALQVAIKAVAARMDGAAVVALPAFSCYDVATAAVGAGYPIRLFDIDPITLGPDLDSLRKALIAGARIIVISPLYGLPVDWDQLTTLAEEFGATVIEDAAQGHGASWRGRPLGSLGVVSVLSFSRGKGWTGGKGGAVLFRRPGFEDPARKCLGPDPTGIGLVLASTGQWLLGRPSLYGFPAAVPWLALGQTRYHEPTPPTGMHGAAAALLLATLPAAAREAAARKEAGRWCASQLERQPGVETIRLVPNGEPGFLRYPVCIRDGVAALRRTVPALRLGIARSYPTTLAALAPVQPLLLPQAATYSGAESLAKSLLTLPTHSRITPVERERAVRLVRTWAVQRR